MRDGRSVLLRPIGQGDAPLLIELHSRLSSDTQYLRFFGPKAELTPDEAEYLAGVDFVRRFAIAATAEECGRERLVAVGRFDMTDEDNAEAAIVVRDDYQSQGIGTAILSRLIQVARDRGLRSFSGEVLPENVQMLNLLRKHGLQAALPTDSVVEIRAAIEQSPFGFSVVRTGSEEPEPAPADDQA